MSKWGHVTAPVSRAVLEAATPPTMVDLMKAVGEAKAAFAIDVNDEDIPRKAIQAREEAISALDEIMTEDTTAHDEAGEVTGSAGINKLAAVDALAYYWSDGEHGSLPDPLKHVKEECRSIYDLLTGAMPVTNDLIIFALSFTWLRNEYSERCDLEDFPMNDWEDMQEALRAADSAKENDEVIKHLTTYWRLWRRHSTIY